MSGNTTEENTVLGRIASVYGVKGWVKIYSHTDPIENILTYSPWLLKIKGQWKSFEIEASKRHGKGLVAKLVGVDDREIARTYNGVEIAVESHRLPKLEEGEFYWSQLENLTVYTVSGQLLGKVSHLMETGANDVLVVKGNDESIDRNERLIPYLPDQVIKEIDLETGAIRVDWDPEF
ncbi:ribosome maturation factor RimM [Pontibacterium sp. N1Y112]|uniref:Ribosome maturation factor RimM n=1 Tax=Pontibacterium sinense TaxID=2781979 RepID=A0A8J7F6G3_9GAMM|nr:ribosome maturation factor RimM [Pontibacterium sinense]MBE9395965.1 ribosome maturation factor RimM [Pontibacterium sinense]